MMRNLRSRLLRLRLLARTRDLAVAHASGGRTNGSSRGGLPTNARRVLSRPQFNNVPASSAISGSFIT